MQQASGVRYAIRLGAGSARCYLAHADDTGRAENGWRQLVWTKDMARAEKFASIEAAEAFAHERLEHDRWQVVIAPSYGLPTDDLGGTPAAIRMAA